MPGTPVKNHKPQSAFLRIRTALRAPSFQRRSAYFSYVVLAVMSGIGLAGKMDLVFRVFHIPEALFRVLAATAILVPLVGILVLRIRLIWAPLALLGFLCTATLVYPRVAA